MTNARSVLRSRPELFTSPWLLLPILALVVNDWVLKPIFHNTFTGKLSDFAGLLALTLFICAITERFRWLAASFISVSFIYWKSPYSQPLIAYLNNVLPVGIGRTPDYTDLAALPVVWITAFYAPRLPAHDASAWARYSLAGLCFFALTATSYFPQYSIRENGNIGISARNATEQLAASLERTVDRIAARHGLTCNVCDPISEGRIYGGATTSLSLLARFDLANSQILYEVSSSDVGRGKSGPQEVDAVRAQLEEAFRKDIPSIEIERAGRPAQHSTQIGVSKQNLFTSRRDPQNLSDIEAAKRVVVDVARSFGLRKYETLEDVYYLGALFGWSPYSRELVVYVAIADDPLVDIVVTRSSDSIANLQKAVAIEIERRLKEEFGANRAGKRCWLFSC